MDKDLLRTLLPALVSGHLPRGTRNFRYQVYDNTPLVSSFGIRVDPLPFQGTIIAKTDEAMLIKTGRISFAAVDRTLASLDPAEGTRVEVTPYARRRFDRFARRYPEGGNPANGGRANLHRPHRHAGRQQRPFAAVQATLPGTGGSVRTD